MNRIYIILVSIFILSCNNTDTIKSDIPIARVYEKYLYKSQLENIVPKGLSAADSTILVKDHIDKWVRKQLLMYQAEQYLLEDEKNIEQQIDDYRSSILIFKYEQNFIKQKLDTLIDEKDIEKYYNEHTSNFILNTHLIKGIYIQLPKSAPEISKIRRLYRSDRIEDIKDIESYCYSYALKYDYFDENWINFNSVYNNLPQTYIRPESMLKYHKYYEVTDSLNYYFLKISDFKLASSVAPLEYVDQDIRSILLNKRKIQLIQELESNIYNDALNHDYFNIY